jgi:phage terminase large subunit
MSPSFGRALADSIDPSNIDVFAKLKYRPTQKQQLFHEAQEFDVCLGGARGGGKSLGLLMDAINRCVHVPGLRALLLRKTFPELKQTVIMELARHGFAKRLGCSWNGSDYTLKFPNGSVLQLGFCDSLADVARYQGTSWGLLCIDEMTLLAPAAIEILRETIRSGDEGRSVVGIRSSCNPGGIGHTAIKTAYIEATDYGKRVVTDSHGRSVRYIPSTARDNPHVGKDYIRTLEAIPDPARREAMLNGNWSAFGGQFFSEWSPFRHIVPRDAMTLAPSWRRYCGIDFGFAAPFCALWAALDGDGRWWIYREIYEKGLAPEEQAKRIMAAERKDGWVAHFIDPSTVAKPTGGLSVHEMFAIAGLPCALAANDRLPGWQQVHKALSDGPLCLYHAHLAAKGEWSGQSCPRLHVLDGAAPNLCRTLPDAPYDPIRVEDLDTRVEDHACDSLRYLIASTGLTGQITVPDDPGPRKLTVQELGGPDPLPLIAGRFAGNMRQGLEGTGVDFGRTDGSTPGATQKSPFVS